jgi:hypothetical protein
MSAANRGPERRDTISQFGHVTPAALRDLDIRHALRAHLAHVHAGDTHTRVIEEMELCLNAARVDLAVVNGRLEGFEIKSDRDRLDRLARQADVYNRVFDRMTVVAGQRHLPSAIEAIPVWWGVSEARAVEDGVELRVIRPAQNNPEPDGYSVAQLLRRAEALAILDQAGASRGVRSKSLPFVWQRLVDALPADELACRVRDALIARADWRSRRPSSAHDATSLRRARSSDFRSGLPPHRR